MALFEAPALSSADREVVALIDELQRRLRYHVAEPRRWSGLLRRVSLARAIRGSNSIEGFVVSVDDAFAALDEEEPLEADAAAWAAVRGYRNAMTYVLQLARDDSFVLSVDTIKALHFMLQSYDLGKWPGRLRPGEIFVFDDDEADVVYTGPDPELVPGLMDEFVADLATGAADDRPPMVRAAMAHLNLTMIHPFRDGNGRMARCVQTLLLAREGVTAAEFCSIEEYLGRNERDYYDVLKQVGRGRWSPSPDTDEWIKFCLTAHYRQALTVERRSRESERLWLIAEREAIRAGLPDRSIDPLFYALSRRRLRNSTYRQITDVSQGLASKDLGELARSGLLEAVGEKRGRFYVMAERLRDETGRIVREIRRSHPLDADPYAVVEMRRGGRQQALWGE